MAGKPPVWSTTGVSTTAVPVEKGCVDITVDSVTANDETEEKKLDLLSLLEPAEHCPSQDGGGRDRDV